jgi:hypothetical protein
MYNPLYIAPPKMWHRHHGPKPWSTGQASKAHSVDTVSKHRYLGRQLATGEKTLKLLIRINQELLHYCIHFLKFINDFYAFIFFYGLCASIKTYIKKLKTMYRAYIPKELYIHIVFPLQTVLWTQSRKAPEGIPTRIENNSPLSHFSSISCGLSLSPFWLVNFLCKKSQVPLICKFLWLELQFGIKSGKLLRCSIVFAHLVTATKDQLKKIAAATEPLKPDFLLLITNKRPA